MGTLNEPIAKRIAAMFRLLGSDFEGEALGAIGAMKRLFKSEGLTFNDIATVIENAEGEIEEKKYSDADAETIYAKGVERGKEQARRDNPGMLSEEFCDEHGEPKWIEVALWCQLNGGRLRSNEIDFVNDMCGRVQWRAPTEKQAKWLLSIFLKLGGRRLT